MAFDPDSRPRPPKDGEHLFAPLINPPMYVVTCALGERRAGCLVEFAVQCAMRPVRFLVCLSMENFTYRLASEATTLAVHFLTERELPIASHFGELTGDEVDKFESVAWHRGAAGTPILDDCPSFFEGQIVLRLPFGDHVGFVLAPIEEVPLPDQAEGDQLKLEDVKDFQPGHPLPSTA